MTVYKAKKPTKDGRLYYFRIKYKDVLGNIHDYTSPKYKGKPEATDEEAKYRIKVMNNETLLENLTIKQIFIKYMSQKELELKPQTIIKTNNHFKYLKDIENKRINDLNYNHIELIKNKMNKANLSPEYKNKILGLLQRLIKYSNKYYNTSTNILKFCEPYKIPAAIKKEMQFFTLEEYLAFDKVIDNFSDHVFFELLFYLGLRKGEAQALRFKDFRNNQLIINKTLTTKIKGENWTITSPKTSTSNRIMPLTTKIIDDLNTLKAQAMKYTDYNENWFIFGFSVPYRESTIYIKKQRYCQLANVKEIRIHDFRHSCASLLINQGASITLVSKYLGHSNIAITLKTYTHLYKSELEDITEKLNKI